MKGFIKAVESGMMRVKESDRFFYEKLKGIETSFHNRVDSGLARDKVRATAMVEVDGLHMAIAEARRNEAAGFRSKAEERRAALLSGRASRPERWYLELAEARTWADSLSPGRVAEYVGRLLDGSIGASREQTVALAAALNRGKNPGLQARFDKYLEEVKAFDPVEGDPEVRALSRAAQDLEAKAASPVQVLRFERANDEHEGEAVEVSYSSLVDID